MVIPRSAATRDPVTNREAGNLGILRCAQDDWRKSARDDGVRKLRMTAALRSVP